MVARREVQREVAIALPHRTQILPLRFSQLVLAAFDRIADIDQRYQAGRQPLIAGMHIDTVADENFRRSRHLMNGDACWRSLQSGFYSAALMICSWISRFYIDGSRWRWLAAGASAQHTRL